MGDSAMPWLALAVDPALEIGAAELVAAWEADEEARRLGSAGVEAAGRDMLLPGIAELVVIPLAVDIGGGALYDLVKRLVRTVREPTHHAVDELEIAELTTASADRVVVIR